MPKQAAKTLRLFIESCYPLSTDIDKSIDSLQQAIAKVRYYDEHKSDSRRTKRFEDAAKSLKLVRDLLLSFRSLRVGPHFGAKTEEPIRSFSSPLYISLDLGMRQRRKHYHGGIIFQCIVLPNNFFDTIDVDEHHELLISPTGRGIKVAEGGNFSDLVRANRPPGNFASSIGNYSVAPIPTCAGVRFSIGKLVELIYLDATLSGKIDLTADKMKTTDWIQKSSIDREGLNILRKSLGHPLAFERSVQCVVASMHGMDAASAPERFYVASRLWTEGVSAEYLTQSGVLLSLLKRAQNDADEDEVRSDWSLLELHGVCALLKIPFMVIVQKHILREKKLVRLRPIAFESFSQASSSDGSNEIQVSIDDLAYTILGSKAGQKDDYVNNSPSDLNLTSSERVHRSNKTPQIECIYIDNDQYFGNDREVSRSDTPHYKSYLKNM